MYNLYIKNLLRDRGTINEAYVALGGNIGNVVHSIKSALSLLSEPPIIQVIASSPIYLTSPVGGPEGQPDYYNAAVRLSTSLTPRALLERCLSVEKALGRVRGERWGPRTIDLDLILFNDEVIDEPGLTLPHPRLRERLFVLVPLCDVAPSDLCLPPDFSPLFGLLEAELTRSNLGLDEFKKKIFFDQSIFGTNIDN